MMDPAVDNHRLQHHKHLRFGGKAQGKPYGNFDKAGIRKNKRKPRLRNKISLFRAIAEDSSLSFRDTDVSSRTAEFTTSHSTLLLPSSSRKSILKVKTQSESVLQSERCRNNKDESALQPPRSVSFAEIEFREYEITLGDNPSVSTGPPLALGRKVLGTNSCSIDDYESHRPPRRNKGELIVPRFEREQRLRELGWGRGDFKVKAQEIEIVKQQRRRSSRPSAFRKVQLLIFGSRKGKSEFRLNSRIQADEMPKGS